MKYYLLLLMFWSTTSVLAYPNDLPRQGWPLSEPPQTPPEGLLPHRVTWSISGSRFLGDYARQVCRGATFIRCVSINTNAVTGAGDWGFRIYRKDTGAYLGTLDRNVGEEIEADYVRTVEVAEQHHPESAWVARKEAEKAQLEYIAAACTTGAVYCTGMAAKMPKFKELFSAACSLWSGVCITKVNEMKADLQKRIDYVKNQCAAGDQQCWDAITDGGESKARAQRALEKSAGMGGGGSGQRPPHDVRPKFMPGSGTDWYDSSCSHCKIYEGKSADDY